MAICRNNDPASEKYTSSCVAKDRPWPGGIGFLAAAELWTHAPLNRRSWRRLSLYSKLVLTSTALLILAGTAAILFMERSNTLSALSGPQRVLTAFFQSITARTAGFNTLPIGALASETLFVIIMLWRYTLSEHLRNPYISATMRSVTAAVLQTP
jgi:hypothetical protein